jgi:MFS family permease
MGIFMKNGVLETRPKLKLVAQIGLLMGPFLSMMDSNIVNVALPNIAKTLGSKLTDAQWIVSGYMLALAACLAVSAYLAKRFGTINVYRICLLGFTAGSAFCALSTSMNMLILARIVQGLLGAPLIPLAMSMIFGGGIKAKAWTSHQYWG